VNVGESIALLAALFCMKKINICISSQGLTHLFWFCQFRFPLALERMGFFFLKVARFLGSLDWALRLVLGGSVCATFSQTGFPQAGDLNDTNRWQNDMLGQQVKEQ